MTVGEALGEAAAALAASGVEGARRDAAVLLAWAAELERADLEADSERELAEEVAQAFEGAWKRRAAREPVAYIVRSRGFRWIELGCDPRALIPRPETELLVEVGLERRPATVLDAGTGTGAIALAVLDELPSSRATATDASPAALELAAENAARLGAGERLELLEGSVPEQRSFELVLANLPYVPESEWRELQPEVRDWEPREALVGGGEDGLGTIRALAPALVGAVAAGGAIALEVGEGQASAVCELLVGFGLERIEARRDLAGIERVACAVKPR